MDNDGVGGGSKADAAAAAEAVAEAKAVAAEAAAVAEAAVAAEAVAMAAGGKPELLVVGDRRYLSTDVSWQLAKDADGPDGKLWCAGCTT